MPRRAKLISSMVRRWPNCAIEHGAYVAKLFQMFLAYLHGLRRGSYESRARLGLSAELADQALGRQTAGAFERSAGAARSDICQASTSGVENLMNVSERQAPELRVQRWIGANGEKIAPLKLSDLGAGPKILFAFQDWCGGCHSHGFPTLQALHAVLSDQGVGFAVIQTVFEGAHENTFERLRPNQLEYELPVAFGHDEPPAGSTLPTFMQDYRTRGTPWFTVIDAGGRIILSDFRLDVGQLVKALEQA